MKRSVIAFAFLLTMIYLPSCQVVRQGDVGVKRTLGKIKPEPLQAGPRLFNPFVSIIIPMPVRTVNIEVRLELPSREGVNVMSEISILYRIKPEYATHIIEHIGRDYENIVIMPVFRASAADVSARFMAKDMHTGNRSGIEEAIRTDMMRHLEDRGFVIESVLMKSIQLPKGLYRAIEEKLEAEQDAQRMEFILQREKQEAERRLIEAEGIRDANMTIAEGLTPEIIQYKSIEAFRELSRSQNAKIIITDGRTPMLINPDQKD